MAKMLVEEFNADPLAKNDEGKMVINYIKYNKYL